MFFNIHPKFRLLVSISVSLLIGAFAGLLTFTKVVSWYSSDLIHPAFFPPLGVFVSIWVMFYILLGFAFWKFWIAVNDENDFWIGTLLFITQLVLTVLVSYLSFRMNLPMASFAITFLLMGVIFGNIIVFFKFSKISAYIMIPYLVWVLFSAIINNVMLILNA